VSLPRDKHAEGSVFGVPSASNRGGCSGGCRMRALPEFRQVRHRPGPPDPRRRCARHFRLGLCSYDTFRPRARGRPEGGRAAGAPPSRRTFHPPSQPRLRSLSKR